MALIVDRTDRNIVSFRLFDQLLHDRLGNGEAKSPITVDDQGRRRFLFDLNWCAGDDVSLIDPIAIRHDAHHAVRVMPGQIGIDAVTGDDLGFFGTNTGALKNYLGKRLQAGCWNCWHL